MVNSKLSNQRIFFLDYLRVFAFLSVLVGHKFFPYLICLSQKPWLHDTARQFLNFFLPLFVGGGAGVVVFFLVSGYVITWSIQRETASRFLFKRFFRIYPLYITAVLIETGLRHSKLTLGRFTLLGDFWGAPYALAGVEWTLRVEILFYLVMAGLKTCGLFDRRVKYLSPFLFISLFLIQLVSPFPEQSYLFRSYVTTYGSFLLMGVMFFLTELRLVNFSRLAFFVILAFLQYFYNIAKYQPGWLSTHFAAYGLILFFIFWRFRNSLVASPLLYFFSELTYSIYLFHNWLFDFFYGFLVNHGFRFSYSRVLALGPLLAFCFFISRVVEKPAINLCKYLLAYLSQGIQDKTVSNLS